MPRQALWTRGGRILAASLALGSLALAGVLWWYYVRERDAIEDAVFQQLAAIAQAKVTQITTWRRERIGDGRVQAVSGTVSIARRILSGSAQSSDRVDLAVAMQQLEQEFLYTGAFVVDRGGGIREQFPADHPAPSRLADFARAGAAGGDVKLEDLYLDARSKRPLMALSIPVEGLGALILEIDPARFLYPYLAVWPVASASGEASLVRLNGDDTFVYLNELRGRRGAALAYRRSLAAAGAPPLALLETGWRTKGADYRGAIVLAMVRRVPDSPWYLITKIDAVEADEPVRRLGWEMALMTALIGMMNATLAGLLWRGRELRHYHEREAWFRAVANDTPAYLWMRKSQWTTSSEKENSFINVPLQKFLGVDGEPLSGSWTDRLHPGDMERAKATFLDALAERREYVTEYRMRRADGQYRRVVSRGLPRFSAEGEFLGYAGCITDITDMREAEEQLRSANAALADELAQRTLHEEQIQSLSARLMHAQEDERRRVARELHDDLCQQIAALSIAMGNLKRHISLSDSEARSHSDRIQQKLAQTAETVRRISHQLHPAVLEYSGLASALRAYCEEFTSLTGIRVVLETAGSFEDLPLHVALSFYRIAQEALQNVAKHARSAEATVTLRRSQEVLRLSIEDQGVGIDLLRSSRAAGLGLVSIRERTRLIGGAVEILNRPNGGTAVIVEVPQGNAGPASFPAEAAAG